VIETVRAIARLEFTASTRQRWVRFFSAAFALLSLAAAYSSGAMEELGAPEGFARTTVALVPLVVLLVPLAALLLGLSGQAVEAGGEIFLFAQPVTRFEIVLGKWAGQALALAAALAIGFGAGGAFLAATAGGGGLLRFLFFVAVSILLSASFLAIAAAIAARARTRALALGLGAFVWFFFVLLYDGAALGAAGWISGRAGARVLFSSVFGNPADLARVLTLSVAGTPHIMGAAGEAWTRFLGGAVGVSALSGAALLLWVAAPLEAARRWINRRDL
jgi:Cu-processing system permease protein